MGIKEEIRGYIQENIADLAEFFLDNIKIVSRGDIIIDIDNKRITTENAYLAIIDKRKGKDMFKKHIPLELNLKFPSKIKTGWELKTEFNDK